MARTSFKGVNVLISVGVPAALAPVATYGASLTSGGLKVITAIANEPSTLLFVPTGKSFDLHKQKTSERHKFHGGTEVGDLFEQDESIMGSVEAVLVRSVAADGYYDPAIDLMIQAAQTSNQDIYVKMERYMGFVSATLGHSYHVKAALVKVKSDNNTVAADSKAVTQNFSFEGSGNYIEGYQYKL
jgi:hypothetical protein